MTPCVCEIASEHVLTTAVRFGWAFVESALEGLTSNNVKGIFSQRHVIYMHLEYRNQLCRSQGMPQFINADSQPTLS